MNKHTEFIQDVVITIHMNLKELQERKNFAAPEELDHIDAKLLAYCKMLSVLRSSAEEFGIDKEELRL